MLRAPLAKAKTETRRKPHFRAFWRPIYRIWWHHISCFCCAKK